MEIDTGNENWKKIYYNLYMFEEDIVKTITDALPCESCSFEDYGEDYYYDFHYKNIFVNIRYVYNGPTWRSENVQEMVIQYD